MFLSRIFDPFWFQSFSSVVGIDYNSSGVKTDIMSALKKIFKSKSSNFSTCISLNWWLNKFNYTF